jgi:zinc protease
MRRIIFSLLALISLFSTAFAEPASRVDPRTMKFQGLNYEIPRSERVLLDCGIPVYLLRDTELPIVNVSAMVRGGSVYDPPGKTGLASMTGVLLRSGGAGGLSAEKMDDELEFMASSVESSIGRDMGTVSLSALSKNLDRTLQIFMDVLLKPDFSEKRLEIIRRQMVEGLRRQNDDPKEIAGRELLRAIYKDHPLGAVPDFKSVAAISRQDLVAFHQRFFRTSNMILTVSGDFERDQLLARLNALFGKPVDEAGSGVEPVPQPKTAFNQEILYGKKESGQTVIRMGHMGITKDNPDIYAVRLLDYILGGSFTSRLMMEVRTNQGLAYNVGSHFDVGRLLTGTFTAETETKPETTVKVIELMRDIIAGITREEVSEQELKAAREAIVNSFMFGFTSPGSIVMQRARLEFYGYQSDYLDKYRERISAVTRQDILSAARKYLRPEAFKIVVVGNDSKFDKPLASLGKVDLLKLTHDAVVR